MDRDNRRFERHSSVSIQMPDGLLEKLSKNLFPLTSLMLHFAGSLPRPSRLTAVLANPLFNG